MTIDAPSRELILDAAERLFARQGFAATTIKEIGQEAAVNPALLYYYFDSKETLYRATIQRIIGHLVEQGSEGIDAARNPSDQIRAVIRAQARVVTAHPHLPHLFVREMVDHRAAHAQEAITALAAGIFKRLCDVIVAGQTAGIFEPKLDPRFAAVSIIAQLAYFFIAQPAVAILLGYGADRTPPAVSEQYFAHAEEFALAALRVGYASPALESGP